MSPGSLPAPAKHLFRYLFEQASLGIAVEDLEGKILLANPALCSMLGYTEKELCNMSCSEFANPEDFENDWALFQQLRSGMIDHYSLEKRYRRKDGAPLWGRLNVSLLKDDDGAHVVFAFVENITESKAAEEAQRDGEQRLRLAIQAGRMYAFEWNVATDVIVRSKESAEILDWENPENDTGRAFHARIHPDDLALYNASEARLAPENPTYQIIFRTLNSTGSVIWLEDSGRAFFDGQGTLIRVIGIVADITARKQAQEEFHGSEERFRLAAQAGKMFAYEWDAATDKIVRSEGVPQVLGVDAAEHTTGQELSTMVPPEDRARLTAAIAQLSPEEPHLRISYRMVRSDGSVIWVERTSRAYFDGHGRMLRIVGMVADVTERKRAEERLREYEKAIEGSEQLIAVVDREYRYLIANREFLKLRNLTKEQVVGRLVPEVLNKQIFEGIVKEKMDACFAGNVVKFEMRYTYPEIGERDLFVSYFPIEGATGVDRVACILQDITEQKRAEEALKKSEEKFSKAFQQGPMAVTLTSTKDHRYIEVNETFERITGWRRDEAIGRTPLDLGLWVNPAGRFEVVERLLAERSLRNLEYPFRMKDGTIRIGFASAEVIDLDGEPCMLAIIADITDYKRSQEALREGEARERTRAKELEAILDAVPVPVVIAQDAECRHMTGNRAAFEQLRVAAGGNFSLSAPSGERPSFRHMKNGVEVPADLLPMQQAAATGKPVYGCELTFLFEDGTTREEIGNAVPLLDETGKPRGAVGTSMDVTELKRTERALRESEDKLRLLLDSTAEAIYGIDLDHRCTFCNPACLRTLGYERVDELLGKNMHHLIHHTHADGTPFPVEECRVDRVARTGEGDHSEDEVLWRANGTSFPAEYWSYPQRRGHEVVGAVVAFIDISDRKLVEAALANVSRKLIEAQEQERSRIGRELHDDIGQRLALLAVELQQLRNKSVTLPQVRRRVRKLQKRTSEIAADVQSLSHELHSAKLQYLGITAAVKGFCREFAEQQKVEINFESHDLPIPLSTDVSLCLFRVLQEALHNSAKHSGVRYFEVRLWGTADEIHLTVRDSGAGFDLEAARTSQGLGLISMEERLKMLNGTLSVETFLKRGTTIHARVPFRSAADAMRAAG